MLTNVIEKLIQITNEHLPKSIASNNGFNIFKVLGIESKEVLICRFLGELLNPIGSHKLGSEPLELFINVVLGINDETSESIANAMVDLEEHVDRGDGSEGGTRRADVVIHTEKRVYPIEAKINAGDQPAQLFDYYRHFFKEGEGVIYYLTPTGHEPSKDSIGKLEIDKEVKLISFVSDQKNNKRSIEEWIGELLKSKRIGITAVKSIIEQFLEVIKEMNNSDSEAIKYLKDLVSFKEADDKLPDNIAALTLIYRNGGDLLKDIQQKYIRKYVSVSGDYELASVDEKPKRYKDHTLVSVKKDGVLIAWINEDNEGLYLISNTDKKPEVDGWESDHGDLFWKRIKSTKGKKINMERLTFIPSSDDKIDISYDLSEVMKEMEKEDNRV